MCLLGANLFKDILNQTKWKLEIFSHICLSEQAQRFNSVNHVFFKDANILLEVFRLFSHFFCDSAHEIFYRAQNFFTTHWQISHTDLHLRGLVHFLRLVRNEVILLRLDNLLDTLLILHFHLNLVLLF
jgi:hypothetical protein